MSFFYSEGQLKVGNQHSSTDVLALAKEAKRPAYIYDLDHIEARFKAYQSALSKLNAKVHYATKANSNSSVLKRLAQLGAGADTVSIGEVRLAIDAGIPASQIILSGVAKTVAEIEEAIRLGIKQINVESPQELERIAKIASQLKRHVNVAFRMNPDVDAKTHPYITTGFRENKFGMDESFLPELAEILKSPLAKEFVRLRGLTMHIGSLLFDLTALREAMEKVATHHNDLNAKGFKLDRFDIGGGLGIRYETNDETEELSMLEAYGQMVTDVVTSRIKNQVEVLTEPGRFIVGRAGILVGEVQYIKRAPAKTFAILDTGMHHLLRPALYQAKHRVLALDTRRGGEFEYDVVGPICESSDVLARSAKLPELKQGDYLAMADAGAYGFAMASRYNAHEWPVEISISQGKPHLT